MFLGTLANSPCPSSAITPCYSGVISQVKMGNIILDEIYAQSGVIESWDGTIPQDWDYNVILHGDFDNTTYAGNVAYSADIVYKAKLKRRKVGEFSWKTILEKEVNESNDFLFDYIDYYEPSCCDVEYGYFVSLIENVNNDILLATKTVHSKFDNQFICDKNGNYAMIFNFTNDITYNRSSNIIVSPGSKYPYVNHNGKSRYYSGTINVAFLPLKDDCTVDTSRIATYRQELDEWLSDGNPKILKNYMGEIWMVNIVNSIPHSNTQDSYKLVSYQIEWVECGDPNSVADLYDNNFIDFDTDRNS